MSPHSDFELEIFARSSRHPVWTAAILQTLSEDRWSPPSSLRSVAQIETSFEEDVEEAMDDKRWVLSDPECAEYLRASLHPDEHPWGDDIVRICRRFLAEKAGAGEILGFVDRIMKRATEALADELETLTLGEGGDRFAKSVERTFKEEVQGLRKTLGN